MAPTQPTTATSGSESAARSLSAKPSSSISASWCSEDDASTSSSSLALSRIEVVVAKQRARALVGHDLRAGRRHAPEAREGAPLVDLGLGNRAAEDDHSAQENSGIPPHGARSARAAPHRTRTRLRLWNRPDSGPTSRCAARRTSPAGAPRWRMRRRSCCRSSMRPACAPCRDRRLSGGLHRGAARLGAGPQTPPSSRSTRRRAAISRRSPSNFPELELVRERSHDALRHIELADAVVDRRRSQLLHGRRELRLIAERIGSGLAAADHPPRRPLAAWPPRHLLRARRDPGR